MIIITLLTELGILYFIRQIWWQNRFNIVHREMLPYITKEELCASSLYIASDRIDYVRGQMALIIPAISVFTYLGESAEPKALNEMPGLYVFSELPGEGDRNVSIAGHRDVYKMEFCSLDKVEKGYYAYLLLSNTVFRYKYKDSRILSPIPWSVIQPQGFSCLTLTTRSTMGTCPNNFVVRWELEDSVQYDGNYFFKANSSETTL